MERGLLEIGEVHRDLDHITREKRHSKGFHGGKTSAAGADAAGDGLSNREVFGFQIDIEGDQNFACSYDNGPGGRVKSGTAEIGSFSRIMENGFAKPLKLAAPDVLEGDAFWASGSGSVEVHGNSNFAADAFAGTVGEGGAIFERGGSERHERQHIKCANARVNTAVMPEIDGIRGLRRGAYGCL